MRRGLRRLALAALSLIVLTGIAVVASAAVMVERHGPGRSPGAPVDAAIVLGAGVDPDGILHYSTRRRVAAGVALLRAGAAGRLIMSGGKVDGVALSAAELMREHAVALGAPARAVLVETASDTTFENIRFSFAVAEAAGLGRLAIVTDDTHLLRARLLACYFGECGIGLAAVPTFSSSELAETAHTIGREAVAWWYNLGKAGLWSALGALGAPPGRREALIE